MVARFPALAVVILGTALGAAAGQPPDTKGFRAAGTGNVNPADPDATRVKTLWATIGQVVDDLDTAGKENKKKFLLHVAWHEGARIKKRVQDAGGPARSFYQMERAKAIDAVDYAKTKGWVVKLATAAGGGTTQQQILAAWTTLKENPTVPQFPAGNLIEAQLRSNDLFGTYMARIVLLRIPAAIGSTNQQHAEYWADHWKVSFSSPAERAMLIMRFKQEADEVDRLIP